MNTMKLLIALMLTAALGACNNAEKKSSNVAIQEASAVPVSSQAKPQDTIAPAPFEKIVWKLRTMAGKKLFKNAAITLTFHEGGISGSGGCNQYSGTYTVDESGVLSVSELASSKRTCDGLMGQESKFFEALRGATSIKMNKIELVISSRAGDLVFNDRPDAPVKTDDSNKEETPAPKKQ